jgi:hypothetical protein
VDPHFGEFFCLFCIAYEHGELKGVRMRMLEEARKNGASDVACATQFEAAVLRNKHLKGLTSCSGEEEIGFGRHGCLMRASSFRSYL